LQGDTYDGVTGAFDLIVTNPPYIPDGQIGSLQTEVRQFEPHSALAGGTDGLDIVRKIISGAPHFLTGGGVLLMEIGFDQSDRVRDMFDPAMWDDVMFLDDLQCIPRIVRGRRSGT
jgi:release factor glutamine methyltransferase